MSKLDDYLVKFDIQYSFSTKYAYNVGMGPMFAYIFNQDYMGCL